MNTKPIEVWLDQNDSLRNDLVTHLKNCGLENRNLENAIRLIGITLRQYAKDNEAALESLQRELLDWQAKCGRFADENQLLKTQLQNQSYEVKQLSSGLRLRELREENERLKELAWRLDDYTIHSRNVCESLSNCTCGLSEARTELKALARGEGK